MAVPVQPSRYSHITLAQNTRDFKGARPSTADTSIAFGRVLKPGVLLA